LIAWSVRLSHLPFDFVIFLWHALSLFLFLLACWQLSRKCFADPLARWGAVGLVAALLTLPVAGTALYIMDQYLNPRSIAAFALLFAIVNTLERKYVRVGAWLAFAVVIHPQNTAFGFCYLVILLCMANIRPAMAYAASLLPFGLSLRAPSEAYREAVQTRPYFFILRWEWYEWVGIFAPLALLWWFSLMARRHRLPVLELLSRALVVFGLFFFALALVLTIPVPLEGLARFQPMRSLHLVYIFLFLLGGGLLGQWVLKDRTWRWIVLFVPLCAGMWYAQRELFPASPHIEWPGVAPKNSWLRAFEWIRQNTPPQAVFAIDPMHMVIQGEDQHGFRALAERSMLADGVKDPGAATLFPDLLLAEHWREQVRAQAGWKSFQAEDFRRLKNKYGVTWVVLQRPGVAGLNCPYENDALLVCRVD